MGVVVGVVKNFEFIKGIMEHRIAFLYILDRLSLKKGSICAEDMYERAKNHDMDKVYLATLVDELAAESYHGKTSPHHIHVGNELKEHDVYDVMEAVIDLECKGYTDGKSASAFVTLHSNFYLEEPRQLALGICNMWGIDVKYEVSPEDPVWLEYRSKYPVITEEYVIKKLEDWKKRCPKVVADIERALKKDLV